MNTAIFKRASFVLIGLVLLSACGNSNKPTTAASTPTSTESAKTSPSPSASSTQTAKDTPSPAFIEKTQGKIGDVKKSDSGTTTLIGKKDVGQTLKSGPMQLTLGAVQILDMKPLGDLKKLLGNVDQTVLVSVSMRAQNTTDDTVSFYPDQAVLTTSTGEQIENAELFLSDHVGGDFIGKVSKEGKVIYQLKKPADNLQWVRLVINGASNKDFKTIGDKVDIKVDLER